MPLRKNGTVLDIGFGLGKTTKEIASVVPNGKVIALEIDKDKVESLQKEIEKLKIGNIKPLVFNVDDGKALPLRNSSCDAVLLIHTLRHVIYRESLLKECQRVLSPGGIILLIESRDDAFGLPAHPDARILLDDALEYLDRAGFLLGENFDTNHEEYGIIGVCPHSEK